MKLYRILKVLSYGDGHLYPPSLHELPKCNPDTIEILIQVGAINVVSGPPLEALPGFSRRGERLQECGIELVTDFLSADAEQLSEWLNVKKSTIESWKEEAKRWLIAQPSG